MCKKIKLLGSSLTVSLFFLLPACEMLPKKEEINESKKLEVQQIMTSEKFGDECDSPESSCFEVELSYPEINSQADSVIEILKDSISRLFLSSPFDNKSYSSTEELNGDLEKMYAEFKEDFPEVKAEWFLDRKIELVGQYKDVLTISFFESSFMGGAHPNAMLFYKNYSLKSGKILRLEDLINNDQLQLLTEYAEKEFKNVRGIDAKSNFADEGYWFPNNNFSLNDNFFINEEGITFYFNSYEIAPYSYGETVITIPSGIYLPN